MTLEGISHEEHTPDEEIVMEGSDIMTPQEYEERERKNAEEVARFLAHASKEIQTATIRMPKKSENDGSSLKEAA